jgi:molecular chaperone GrpE
MSQPHAAEPSSETAPETDVTPEGEIARLQDELAGMKDKALRALAEAENTRRQAERQREESVRYAVTGFARDLLNVADNLSRALQNAPAGSNDPFVTGISMTERELATVLERHGVRKIEPLGEAFDPNRHQAIAEAPGTGMPAGQVVQVIQAGYILHDRLLRPALVIVASGDEAGAGHVEIQA